MEALFIVPAMVSPQVNEKLIPALTKLIERNVILNNAALFKSAALEAFKGGYPHKTVTENGVPVIILSDGILNEDNLHLDNIGNLILEAKNDNYVEDVKNRIEHARDRYESAHAAGNRKDEDFWKKEYDRQNDTLINYLDKHDDISNRKNKDNQDRIDKYFADTRKEEKEDQDRMDKLEAERNKSDREDLKLRQDSINKANDYNFKSKDDIRKDRQDKRQEIKDIEDSERNKQLDKLKVSQTNTSNRKADAETQKIKADLKDRETDIKNSKLARSADDVIDRRSQYSPVDSVESPGDINFFKQVSLEPTILNIPIRIGRYKESDLSYIRVGVKCVPYIINSANSLVKLLNDSKNMNWFERQFRLGLRKILTKIPFTKKRWINKGDYIDPDKAVTSVIFSPNRKELSKVNKLAGKFSQADSSPWSTMIVISSFDIEDNQDLVKFISSYKKMTKYVIGDLIITNETKESAYFCTPRINHCQEIPFEYLKKVLNLKDVLDYSEASRASAWKMQTNYKNSNYNKAISENIEYKTVESKVNDILKGF